MLNSPKAAMIAAGLLVVALVRIALLLHDGYRVVDTVEQSRISGPAPAADQRRAHDGDPCTPLVVWPRSPGKQVIYLLPIGTLLPRDVVTSCRVLHETFDADVQVLPLMRPHHLIPYRVHRGTPADRTFDACALAEDLDRTMNIGRSAGAMLVAYSSDPMVHPCTDDGAPRTEHTITYALQWDDRASTKTWDSRSLTLVSTASLGQPPLRAKRMATAATIAAMRSHYGLQPGRYTIETPFLATIRSAADLDARSGVDLCAFRARAVRAVGLGIADELRCPVGGG